jgi:hypothetical protein
MAFDAPAPSADGSGGYENGWSERIAKTAAHILYLRGGENVQAARLQGRQPVVVTVYANPETRQITTDWRCRDLRRERVDADTGQLVAGGYNIRAIVETSDRRFLEITAETGVAV